MPKLSSYEGGADNKFWRSFPSNSLPNVIKCNLNISKFEEIISESESYLTSFEVNRALQAVTNFKFGASSCQKTPLHSCFCKNSSNCSKYGVEISDTIASWALKGFVASPFDSPPISDFRINPLMAVDQG